jgi:hypothetical protein
MVDLRLPARDGGRPWGDHATHGRQSDQRPASIIDELVIDALQPLSILQIGVPRQLLDSDCRGVVVRKVRSLDEAVCAHPQHEFDAIVLGLDVADAWPAAAYEQLAELAGSTAVLVQTDFLGPMVGIKHRQNREQDVIVATAEPSLLRRLALAAILRSRALAEEPATQVG